MKTHKTNKILTFLLVLCLIITSVAPAVYANSDETDTAIITDNVSEPMETSVQTESEDEDAEVVANEENDISLLEEAETLTDNENVSLFAEEETPAETTPLYRLAGIEDGDEIIINGNLGKTVFVIDNSDATFAIKDGKGSNGGHVNSTTLFNAPNAAATNVAKVIFYLDDVVVSRDVEAPFAHTLSFSDLGDHTVKAEMYDEADALLETIEKSFAVIYAAESVSYTENYDSENPVIPENMVNQNATVLPSEGTDYWKSAVETFNGSKALSIYSGKNYSGVNTCFAVYPDSLDVTGDLNRILVEFDYSASYYSGNLPYIAFCEGYKTVKNAADYLLISLPIDELKGASGSTFKTTRIGVDLSWDDASSQVTYKVYLNGFEYYRRTTYYAYRQTLNPVKLIPVLASGGTATQWQWYLDNVNVKAFNYVDQSKILIEAPTVTVYDDLGTAKSGITNLDTDISYITVDMDGGTDKATLKDNVTLTDDLTDEKVTLEVVGDKLVLKEQLKTGTNYTLTVSNGVKNVEGKFCVSEQLFAITTKTGEVCADRENTGFTEDVLPELGEAGTVTFNSKVLGSNIIGKTVTVVCAVYEGNKMVAKTISEQTVAAGGVLAPVSVNITERKANTVVEAFIVDNLTDKKPVSNEIYTLK